MEEKFKTKKGFTLVEMAVVMGLAVLLVVTMSLFENHFSSVSLFINQELQNRQGLQQVFEQIITNIRSAGPSSLGSYPIESASSTSFIFYSDINGDGIFERVRYTITSSTLEQGIIVPSGNPLVYATSTETTTTLISNVLSGSSAFSYFDSNYTGTQSALTYPLNVSAIRLVRLSLYVDQTPSLAPQPTYFSIMVDIRNLRSNI